MKKGNNILIAFILNLLFAILEFIGGLVTNSISIISDAIHDMGDAFSIGLSYFLENISKKEADNIYTYGYSRYSVVGAFVTNMILLIGSLLVIVNAFRRIVNPVAINYDGMIIFAILGVLINGLAAYFTSKGESLNQKAVNLHMLEDVLGWVIVLIGAFIIKFTSISLIDPIMSILVAIFILIGAIKGLKNILYLFLERIPDGISIDELKGQLLKIENVLDVHHIHIWSIDGVNNYATIHVVSDENDTLIKDKIRSKFLEYGIGHVTIELENINVICDEVNCYVDNINVKDSHRH